MLTLAAAAARWALLLALLAAGWIAFRGKLPRRRLFLLSCLAAVFALGANAASRALPPLTEPVTLTALGEARAESDGTEVFLDGYTIDGAVSLSGKALEITEGRWFWNGESYGWRPETDSRQPGGLTRPVTIQVPVGRERALNFRGSPAGGLVEVSGAGERRTADTYSEDGASVSVSLGRSGSAALLRNELRALALYAVVLLALSGGAALCLRLFLEDPRRGRALLDKHAGTLSYAALALVTLVLMFCYADRTSLWLDEMYQIYFTKGSLTHALRMCLELSERSTPLALLCSTLWYRMAPYGERWLLLPAMALSAASVFLSGLIGEKVRGRCCGAFAAIFTAFSTTIWLNAAYEYRAYPYFVFFSVLTLYCYVLRCRRPDLGRSLLFSCSMLGLVMTHYFGMIACAEYFLADLWLLRKKRIPVRMGMVYALPGFSSLLWLFAVRGAAAGASADWYALPDFAQIRELLLFLCGNQTVVYGLFLLGAALFAAGLLRQGGPGARSGGPFQWDGFFQGFCLWMIGAAVGLMLVYGRIINTRSTMWSERYFMFLIPFALLLTALGGESLVSLAAADRRIPVKRATCLFLGGLLSLNCLSLISSATSSSLAAAGTDSTRCSEPYREAADWIYSQDDIFDPGTVIVVRRGWVVESGWNEYYVTRQGRRDPLNTTTQGRVGDEELRSYQKVYLLHDAAGTTPRVQAILDDAFTLTQDLPELGLRVYERK